MMRFRPSRAVAVVATILVGLVVLGTGVAPAAASVGSASVGSLPLEYSTDGTTWSPIPPASLFPQGYLISPGDTESATIYLRSTRAAATTLSAAVTNLSSTDSRFSRATTFSALGPGGTSWSRNAASFGRCSPIFTAVPMVSGHALALTMAITLSTGLDAQQEQGSRLGFTLLLGLADAGAPHSPGGCPATAASVPAFPQDGKVVAFTGSGTLYPGLVIAGFIVGLGALLLVIAAARRRRNRKTP
jgi:hypothetical protein